MKKYLLLLIFLMVPIVMATSLTMKDDLKAAQVKIKPMNIAPIPASDSPKPAEGSNGCLTKWVWNGTDWQKADIYINTWHKKADGTKTFTGRKVVIKGYKCITLDLKTKKIISKPVFPGNGIQTMISHDWTIKEILASRR